ncbi:OLC1v1000874C1 [Oldenlandia corymbosa var. corymbosa]|uniref:OLC1v1000874C1 n=1 Tax=Oldenlandia corymbosa var. corymbosa TaxID=529605 RepID=A0AAV1D6R0_OLDCO|nr:OLC1v1000874C1 [Oldenlandia corymbosa var. corymbosa]
MEIPVMGDSCTLQMMMEDIQDAFPPPPQLPSDVLAEPESDIEAPRPRPAPSSPHEAELPPPGIRTPNRNLLPRPRTGNRPRPPQQHPEWLNLIMGFGFAAIGFRSQCQNSGCLKSFSFHLACLCLVLALSALTVSKYITENQQTVAEFLEYAGVFSGFTAFFVAITPTFPLFLQIISWFVYVLSIAVIIFSHLYFS